jgi:type II secretory pathway component PulF
MELALGRTRMRVVNGATISASLEVESAFPRLIVRMVGIGEASGRLPQILDKVADTYEDQVEGAITVSIALLEPVLICLFGFFVLILVLAIYLPVFTAARGLQ